MRDSDFRPTKSLLTFSLIFVAVTAMVIQGTTYCLSAAKTGQSKERLLKKGTFRNEPMRVVSYSAKGKRIESDKKFLEEDDWLDSLTIRLKNTSKKPIVFIEVSLKFPAMEGNPEGPGPGYVRDIKYGSEPLPGEQASGQTKLIMPNEDVDITLSDRDREAIDGAISRLNFPKNTYVKVLLRTVIFDDETMWRAGETLKRDPNEPGTWRVIPRLQGSFLRKDSASTFTSLYRFNPGLTPGALSYALGDRKMAHVRAPPLQLPVCANSRFDHTSNLACSSATGCSVKKDYVVSDLFSSIIIAVVFEDCKNSSGSLCKNGFIPIQQLTERTEDCPWIAGTCNGAVTGQIFLQQVALQDCFLVVPAPGVPHS